MALRKWHADGATAPLKGSDANRKPDFILLPSSIPDSSRELDWRDVIVFGEMKSKNTTDTLRKSYIEGAGKTALLLYAQDGRHSAPYLRMLGHYIVLTFFDRGGSLSTAAFDIHDYPDFFLRILLGISTAPIETIGFDETVFWDRDDKKKKVLVAWKGSSSEDDKGNPTVSLEQLIFISDTLHGRGTTVWAGSMKDPTSPTARRQIVVKDSWIDPLRKFTEGSMLAKLNDANVEGVPRLIHEQQVQGPHPSRAEMKVNMSTHFLRRLVSQSGGRQYQLRVLSRLLTEPLGIQIMAFSSLAQLLIAFLDYVQIHKDAIVKAKVLHRDISLLNLLLVIWDASRGDSHRLDFLDHLPPETREHLQAKIQEIPYRGFLADWGYAVPIDVPQTEAYTTPEPEGPSTSPSTPHHDAPPTSPISPPNTSTSVDNSVPVRIPVPSEGTDRVAYIALSELKDVHEIMLSMGRDPLPDRSQPSVDTNPLYRTGTWSWMATELVMAGAAKPIAHTAGHDLESLFYVLLGICVLFDEPHRPKPEAKLAECFDVYFNTFEPSLLKTTTIQSKMGWSYNIIQHISPYFRPLVPLLNVLRERIVLPMDFVDDSFRSDGPITHDEMSQALLQALCSLDDQFWVPHASPAHAKEPADYNSDHDVRSIASEPDESSELSDASQSAHMPRILRPLPIRQSSGPGFSSSASSSSIYRRQLSNDADSESRALKRSRLTSDRRFNARSGPGPAATGGLSRRFAATAPLPRRKT
ncbi:hypothetical protein EDD15DRAFT_2373072 [Pisolithus albus]|nr:hypothetical protein EDD15DRAFT_2373072 [Pisolithus albus]